MKITAVTSFILHVPVTGQQIADSTHTVTHWGVVGARIETDAGRTGYGYTGTHAHLPSDQLIARCIETCHAPLLIGEDTAAIERLWQRLARNRRCSGSGGPASRPWPMRRSTSHCGT